MNGTPLFNPRGMTIYRPPKSPINHVASIVVSPLPKPSPEKPIPAMKANEV